MQISPANNQLNNKKNEAPSFESLPTTCLMSIFDQLDLGSIKQVAKLNKKMHFTLQRSAFIECITQKLLKSPPLISDSETPPLPSYQTAKSILKIEGDTVFIKTGNWFAAIALNTNKFVINYFYSIHGEAFIPQGNPQSFFVLGDNASVHKDSDGIEEKSDRKCKASAVNNQKKLLARMYFSEDVDIVDKDGKVVHQFSGKFDSNAGEFYSAQMKCQELLFFNGKSRATLIDRNEPIKRQHDDVSILADVPNEILIHILNDCDAESLRNLNQTCLFFNHLNQNHPTFDCSRLIAAFSIEKPLPDQISSKEKESFNYLQSFSLDGKIEAREPSVKISSMVGSKTYLALIDEDKSSIYIHDVVTLKNTHRLMFDFTDDIIENVQIHHTTMLVRTYWERFYLIDLKMIPAISCHSPWIDKPVLCNPVFSYGYLALSVEKGLQIWNMETKKLLVEIPCDSDINEMIFEAGRYLIAHSRHARVYIWHLSNHPLVKPTLVERTLMNVKSLINTARGKLFW